MKDLIACIRNGIWDGKLKQNLKTNIIVSSIAAVFRSNGKGVFLLKEEEKGHMSKTLLTYAF